MLIRPKPSEFPSTASGSVAAGNAQVYICIVVVLMPRRFLMRKIGIMSVLLAILCLSGSGADAQYVGGSWCAYYGGGNRGGGSNCGFYSWEQCQAALSGNGGMCARNQWYSERNSRRRQRD